MHCALGVPPLTKSVPSPRAARHANLTAYILATLQSTATRLCTATMTPSIRPSDPTESLADERDTCRIWYCLDIKRNLLGDPSTPDVTEKI